MLVFTRVADHTSNDTNLSIVDPDEFAPYAQSDTETTSEEGSPVGNVRLPISLTLSRWNLQAKKGKRKLRQASSLFFTSPNPFNNLHEKVFYWILLLPLERTTDCHSLPHRWARSRRTSRAGRSTRKKGSQNILAHPQQQREFMTSKPSLHFQTCDSDILHSFNRFPLVFRSLL